MTFRERLADWISGGALSDLLNALDAADEWRQQDRDRRRNIIDKKGEIAFDLHLMRAAMQEIEAATVNGKSGTAQKIHRMAKEALGE